jgi:hypothetical protein
MLKRYLITYSKDGVTNTKFYDLPFIATTIDGYTVLRSMIEMDFGKGTAIDKSTVYGDVE